MHNLGLLLDVDGPIASPVTRTITIPSILADLVTLARAGVPIAFITGRSHVFVRDNVVAPLLDAGLADALQAPGSRMFGVFEKGATWAPITAAGVGTVTVDETLAVPATAVEAVRRLAHERFADAMFFDDTKLAMVSLEQRTDVAHDAYAAAQPRFEEAAFELLGRQGLGVRYRDRTHPDASGRVPFRLDPTIISTDIESVRLDKDRGAERALAHFAEQGPLPHRWRSVGDSRSDYLMADYLHGAGFEVAHVDVRPRDGILQRPYRVIVEPQGIHDTAGAAFLAHWVRTLELG